MYRIPAIVRTPTGWLLAFAEGRESSSDIGDIDVVLRRSEDAGRTWSDVIVVSVDGADTVGNPVPIVDELSGDVVLLTTRNLAGDDKHSIRRGDAEGTRTVWLQRSSDDGVSWSPAVEITSSVKEPTWRWFATGPGHGIQLTRGEHPGRLVAGANYSTDEGPHALGAMVLFSDDGGHHWLAGARGEGGEDMQPNETAVVELHDGSLYVNARDQDHTPPSRVHTWSDDGGESFRAPFAGVTELRVPVVQAALWALDRRSDGQRLLLASPCHPTTRIQMCLHTSDDGGASWSQGPVFSPGFGGYSDITALPDGRLAVLYEAGDDELYERIELVVLDPGDL